MNIKLSYAWCLLAIFAISCETDTKVEKDVTNPFPENNLRRLNRVTTQIFELDTLAYKGITGEKGTKIAFNRNLFDVPTNAKITAELREYYSFNDLLYNNLQTVTTNGNLLSSSGVIYLNFKANGEDICMKEGAKMYINLPNNVLATNYLYYGNHDEMGAVTWEKATDSLNVVIGEHYCTITKDSLDAVIKEYGKKVVTFPPFNPQLIFDMEYKIDVPVSGFDFDYALPISNFGYINADKIVAPNTTSTFTVSLKSKKKIKGYINVHYVYPSINSIMCSFAGTMEFTEESLPFKGDVYLLIDAKTTDGEIVVGKVKLNPNNKKVVLKLKPIKKHELAAYCNFK